MGPGSQIFKESNPEDVASHSIEYQSMKEQAENLRIALGQPDESESIQLRASYGTELDGLDIDLRNNSGNLSRYSLFSDRIKDGHGVLGYFTSHEDVEFDETPGVEYSTTAVSIKLYTRSVGAKGVQPLKDSYIVLFRLGFKDEEINSSNLGIGENAKFGVVLDEMSNIIPIRVDKDVVEKDILQKIERRDTVNDEEMITEGQIVTETKRMFRISQLDRSDDVVIYHEILNELDEFLESRKKYPQEDNNDEAS